MDVVLVCAPDDEVPSSQNWRACQLLDKKNAPGFYTEGIPHLWTATHMESTPIKSKTRTGARFFFAKFLVAKPGGTVGTIKISSLLAQFEWGGFMGGIERINAFIREKGFDFEVTQADINAGFQTKITAVGRKIWFKLGEAQELLVCVFADWRTGDKHHVLSRDESELSKSEVRELKRFQRSVEREREEKALRAKGMVEELWARFQGCLAEGAGDYLERKKLEPSEGVIIRRGENDAQRILVVPMFDEAGEMWNFQQIYRAGGRYFHKSARTKGLFHLIEGEGDTVYVGEGYATCRAVSQATGCRVYVSFSAGNLDAVTEIALKRHGARSVVLLADWDGETFRKTGTNPGMQKCKELAVKHRLKVALPCEPDISIERNIDMADVWAQRQFETVPLISWEALTQFNFKVKRERKEIAKVSEGVEGKCEDRGLGLMPEGSKAISLTMEEPRKVPVNTEPDDGDYPSKENGFFMQVPKVKMDGTPVVGVDGKQVMRELPDYDCFSRYAGRRFFLKTNDAFTYLYEEAHYRQVTLMQLKNLATALVKTNTSPSMIGQFVEAARNMNFIRADDLAEPKGLINLKNGILDVRTRQILEHSPEYFFKYRLPHEYVKGAACPNWIEFLQRTFEGNQDLVNVCAEIFGYILLGGEPFLHKAFVLSGEGRNGKSTFLDVLKYLIGRANFSSIPVGQLERPFSAIMADGMLANVVGETSTKEINSETFKTAVGGEELIAAHKGCPEYAMPFHARIVMACNKLPHLGDATTGAHEKFYILPFNRYLQEHERTALYAQKFLFPEVSGIINWALDGLERLILRGGLPAIAAVADQSTAMRLETDPVYGWFTEHVVFDPTSKQRIQFKDFYPNYVQWCREQGRLPVQRLTFCGRIAAEVRKQPHLPHSFPGRVLTVTGGLRVSIKPAVVLALPY